MTNNEQITQYWHNFCDLKDMPVNTAYSAWSYGGDKKNGG